MANFWRGWRPWSASSLYLADGPVPLLKSVEYLDRVLAGCCWEVLISRKDPDDSIGALRQAAKSLTLTLASYLADFVAETLRASRTPQGGPQTDEENIHLLGANFWVQPIYQELLHAASGHNVSGDGERKRPCSGLVKIVAKQRRKTRVPAVDTACVADWIGGHCPADSLMIWFPAHWAPQVIRELESREHDFRRSSRNGLMSSSPPSMRSNTERHVTVALYISTTDSIWRALSICSVLLFGLTGSPCLWRSFWTGCRSYGKDWSKGSFWPKHPPHGLAISRKAFKYPCACPTKEISIHGTRQCLHCRLLGLILPTLTLTTSRRPLPISSSLSACKWGYPTCGEVFRHSGTYKNITCGTSGLVTLLGGSRNCLSLIGRVGRVKMSMTLFCPHHIGKHGRRGNIPKKR